MHEVKDKTVDVKDAKFLDSASVCYSLNKKGRWKLAEIIKEKILSDLSSSDVKVTLMKLHKLHRKNNCIGYFTNKGSVKSVVPKKTKYINRLSVTNVNRKPFRNRRRSRRHRGDNPDQNDIPTTDDNEIKYHIVYPTPSSSAVTYTNPDKIGHNVMMNMHSLSKTAVRSKCRKWRCIERDLRCDMDYADDDAFEADSSSDPTDEVHQTRCSSFSDYFESALGGPANTKVKTRKRPLKKMRKRKIKPMLHYLESQVSEVENLESISIYSRPPTTECQPIDVLISNQESNLEHLKNKFGAKVTFAQCEPQTFIIDITDEVTSCLKSSEAFKKVIVRKLELSVFLVFSLKSAADTDTDYGVWEVEVNLPTKLTSIRISTVNDNQELTVDEVISLTARYVETIPAECFYRKDFFPITKTPVEKLNTIDTLSQLKLGTCLLDDLSQTTSGVLSHSDRNDVLAEWIPSPNDDDVCNICYTESSTYTSLRPCGHTFCNDCWKEHLLNAFTFQSKVTCPEYKCEQVMDVGTMLRLVNIRDIQRSEIKNLNTKVQSSSSMKWCPNNKCERILHNYDLKPDCVILCDCGMFVCFECDEERHWPASCDEYALYKNKLNAFGGDVLRLDFYNIPRVKVHGKPCPSCKVFIIKNNGCPSMPCVCGCSFCWSCLTQWDLSSHETCYEKKDEEGTKEHVFIHIDKKVVGNPMESKLYSRAVEFRKMRREKHIKILRSKTLGLKIRISKWFSKHTVSFGDFGFLSEQQFDDLFSDVMNLTMELNYLSEICLVILDSKAKTRNRVLPSLRCSLNCLESYSRILNDVLIDTDHNIVKDPRKHLPELVSLRQTAKDVIASTVNVIQHLRSYEAKQ